MRSIGILAAFAAIAITGAPANAQTAKSYPSLTLGELQSLVQESGLDVVAIERGSIMVSDGAGFPARLSLSGCDVDRRCRVVRIYTRYVIGNSERGMEAANTFQSEFKDATVIKTLAIDEPAVDVGRDASLDGGRAAGEISQEILAAMSDGRAMRERLMEADPFLKATLGDRR